MSTDEERVSRWALESGVSLEEEERVFSEHVKRLELERAVVDRIARTRGEEPISIQAVSPAVVAHLEALRAAIRNRNG